MDKLAEHAIRMLEIVEGENDFYRNDAKRQADIARAVYDTILQVQMLKMADRKTEIEQVEDDAYFLELMGAVERGEISDAGANQAWYEYINHKDEPHTDCPWK